MNYFTEKETSGGSNEAQGQETGNQELTQNGKEGKQPTESKLVQMRLQPLTLERLDKLAEATGTDNRTQNVATSIRIADEILSSIKNGGTLCIEYQDGRKEYLKIILGI